MDFPVTADRILWDSSDSTIFVACDQFNLHTFVYSQVEVGGSGVRSLGDVELGLQWELRIEPSPSPLQHGELADKFEGNFSMSFLFGCIFLSQV